MQGYNIVWVGISVWSAVLCDVCGAVGCVVAVIRVCFWLCLGNAECAFYELVFFFLSRGFGHGL